MKKINIKKMGLPIALVIVIVLSSVVAVWTMNQTDAKKLKENEGNTSTTESTTLADGEKPVTEVYTEIVEVVETSEKDNGEIVTVKSTEIETKVKVVNATEKKEEKTTKETTTEKQTEVEKKETEATTKYVAPVETTKKQENTTKAVATTKAPKPVATTKPASKPTTTKAPKDEYYPALTAADMKTLEAYCKQYVESKGYTYDNSLNWDNCGFSGTVGLSNNLSMYGSDFVVGKGESPLEWAKRDVRSAVNANIYDFGDRDWLSMKFLYKGSESSGWSWTVGYMA